MKLLSKSDRLFLYSLIVFRLVLDWSFLLLAKAQFDMEFTLRFSLWKMVVSYIALIVLTLVSFRTQKLSAFFIRMILFFTIAPLSSVYSMMNESSVFYWSVIITFFIAEIISLQGKSIQENNKILKHQTTNMSNTVVLLSIAMSVITILLMYASNGVPSLSTFVLDSVYEVRQTYVVSSYLSYLLFVTTQVLVPFGIADSFARKKPLELIFYLIVQSILFMWTGHKTWLFSVFLLLGIILIIRLKKNINILFLGVTALTSLGCFFFNNEIGFSVFTLLNRRVLLDPGALKFFYYDYFVVNNHQTIGVSGTLLAPFVNMNLSSNTMDYTYLISSKYTDAPSNAVTGLYGGDIANFGIWAFIFVPVFLVVFCKLVDVSQKRSGYYFTIIFFSYLAYAFNDQRIVAYFLDFRGVVLILFVAFYSTRMLNRKILNHDKR